MFLNPWRRHAFSRLIRNCSVAMSCLFVPSILVGQQAAPMRGDVAGKGSLPTAEDAWWVLEQFWNNGAVRINCGGGEYVAFDGTTWGRDRFFLAGCIFFGDGKGLAQAPFTGDIRGTSADPIYQTERWFPREIPEPSGYRIPLIPGVYLVTLHFAEIYFNFPGKRVFDVSVENRVLLDRYDPCVKGFATADEMTFKVEVADGFLDIMFRPIADSPKISGIEIKPERPRRGACGNLLINGGFELPSVSGVAYSTEAGYLPGWNLHAGRNGFFLEHGPPCNRFYDGAQAMCLNGDGRQAAWIEQQFATEPGRTYVLKFAMTSERVEGGGASAPCLPSPTAVQVVVGDVTKDFSRNGDQGWTIKEVPFRATASETKLRIADMTPPHYDRDSPMIDAVSVILVDLAMPTL
jgi:hypothetical protein